MLSLKRHILTIVCSLLLPLSLLAQNTTSPKVAALQTEMYRLFYQEDSVALRKAIADLMEEAKKAGNDEAFYRAWGNLSVYESTHQRRTHALEIAREMGAYAQEHKSVFGEYIAKHVIGTVYQQMRDYDNAEKTFKEAIAFLHQNAPGQSAAADYIELVLLSVNGHRDVKQGMEYAELVLKEPNVSDQHKMRVLTLLCELEGDKLRPNVEKFNSYYNQRLQARKGTPADDSETFVNLLYHYVNGHYEQALALTDSLPKKDQIDYCRGLIYHAMGEDGKAYEQMLAYKADRDSIYKAERTGLLSDYIVQLNNERLELKNKELEDKVGRLVVAIVILSGTLLVALLMWFFWRRVKLTRKLRYENALLEEANQEEHEARVLEHKERRKAEKELDLKREFLNKLARQLRTPLNPITGFSNILASDNIQLSPEEREMMNEHIQEGTRRLTGIIDSMFELSFYESKSSLDKLDVFSPNLLCQNAIDNIKARNQKPNVEVHLHSTLKDKLTVKSDLQSVSKVIHHLLDNAVKYTDEGAVLLNCSEEERYIRFSVSDTGRGIDPLWHKHIFEPMVITSGSAKASGMDLAICKAIADLLGGRIWLDETYKNGSRFIFEIPKE
jgi:signal transduction histidine kinase